jgi:hypothetical protein
MDLSQVTDINQLKAMAYDQIATKEQAENNLRMINQRIMEVSQQASDAETKAAVGEKTAEAASTTETTTAAPESGNAPTGEPGAESK